MTESQFIELVDACLTRIEDALEATSVDHDCSRTGKVLTIDLDGVGQMVINAQAAVQELWMASKLGAYHFKWSPLAVVGSQNEAQNSSLETGQWLDTRTKQTFNQVLSRDLSQLTGVTLNIQV
jgi:CyaY protein